MVLSEELQRFTQLLPVPPAQIVFSAKCRPRGIVIDEMEFRERRSEQLLSMRFCRDRDVILLARAADERRREDEIAETPELEDEQARFGHV